MNTTANTNTNSDLIEERLKFYADTPMEKNKPFCWTLSSILSLQEALWRFWDKGWNLRAAWYEKINRTTGEVIENKKLNLPPLLEAYCNQKLRKK